MSAWLSAWPLATFILIYALAAVEVLVAYLMEKKGKL